MQCDVSEECEKKIEELALAKIAALEHIAESTLKQNDAFASFYVLAESIYDLAAALRERKSEVAT